MRGSGSAWATGARGKATACSSPIDSRPPLWGNGLSGAAVTAGSFCRSEPAAHFGEYSETMRRAEARREVEAPFKRKEAEELDRKNREHMEKQQKALDDWHRRKIESAKKIRNYATEKSVPLLEL